MPHSSRRSRLRWWRTTILALGLSGLAAFLLLPAGSVVWATPQQSPLRQTIPTLTPTPLPGWVWVGGALPGPADYAPSGVPDFDQKQADWHLPASSDLWTHCGPGALADALWWLDSRSEPSTNAPPQITDSYGLVSAYGDWDDHDPRNVAPLVDDLADCLGTNEGIEGTDTSAFVPALQTLLGEKGLGLTYAVTMTTAPSFDQLLQWAGHGDGVVLLLGFWEWQGDRWIYLGGHYVALAGVEPANRFVAISDPFRDAFEAGETALGRCPVLHPYPHSAEVHNEACYVSHDAYPLVATEGPGGIYALENYIDIDHGWDQVRSFVGQNVPGEFVAYQGDYGGAAISTKVDYAFVVALNPRAHVLHLPVILKGAPWIS